MTQKLSTQELKSGYEKIYTETGIRDADCFYRWIIRILRAKPGQKLLDVACGQGLLVHEGLKNGLQAFGIDIAEAAIRKAEKPSREKCVAGNAQQLPFAPETFDHVTCLGSLENMPNPDLALSEIMRVAKPQALICLMMPNAFWLGDVVSVWSRGEDDVLFQAFERRATKNAWRAFITANGLAIERELRYNRPAFLFRGGKLRSLRKFLTRSILNLATPFNLSWSFVFLCRKQAGKISGKSYLIWEGIQSRRQE